MRLSPALVALLGLVACTDDTLSPPAQHVVNPPLAAANLPGIPFGLFGFSPGDYTPGTRPDTFWTGGSTTNKNLTQVASALAVAESRGLMMWYSFTTTDETFYFKGGTGANKNDFDLAKWKTEFNVHTCPCNSDSTSKVSLTHWIQSGTLAGTRLLDDLAAFTNGTPTFADLEGMGAVAKTRFPGITTAVRQRPTELEPLSGVGTGTKKFVNLDAAWAQYNSRQIAIAQYISAQNAAAVRHGLKMVYGINVTKGGDNAGSEVSVTQLRDWGTPMLQNASTCSFFMWDDSYSQINSTAMLNLSKLAKAHARTACS